MDDSKTKKAEHIVGVMGAFIISIFTLYNISSSTILLLMGIALILAALLIMHKSQFFYLIFILAPNVMAIKIADKDNALLGYVTIIFFLLLLLKNDLTFKRKVFFKLFFGSIFFLIPLLINEQSISFYIRILAFVLVLNIIYNSDREIDSTKLLQYFILGNTLNVLSAVFYNIIKGSSIFSGAFAGIRDDRNYYAISCAIAISMLVFIISNSKRITPFYAINLIVLSFGGILSSSRTFLILFAVIMAFFVFAFFKSPSVRLFILAVIVIFAIGKSTFLSEFMRSFDTLLERFNEDDVAGGNGRFEAWRVYLTYFFSSLKNIFFGCGTSTGYLNSSVLQIRSVEHNSVIQLIFTVGIIGTVGYLLIFSSMISIIISGKRRYFSFDRILPVIITISGYCTVNGAFSDRFIFAFYLSVLCLITDSKNSKEEAGKLPYEDRTAQRDLR